MEPFPEKDMYFWVPEDNQELPKDIQISDKGIFIAALIETVGSYIALGYSMYYRSTNEADPRGFAIGALIGAGLGIPTWIISDYLERAKIQKLA